MLESVRSIKKSYIEYIMCEESYFSSIFKVTWDYTEIDTE